MLSATTDVAARLKEALAREAALSEQQAATSRVGEGSTFTFSIPCHMP